VTKKDDDGPTISRRIPWNTFPSWDKVDGLRGRGIDEREKTKRRRRKRSTRLASTAPPHCQMELRMVEIRGGGVGRESAKVKRGRRKKT